MPHVKDILDLFRNTAKLSYNIGPFIGNIEIIKYLEHLRQELIGSYVSISHGIKETENYEVLIPYIPDLVSFLEKAFILDVSISKDVIQLLWDLTNLHPETDKVKNTVIKCMSSNPQLKNYVSLLDQELPKEEDQDWKNEDTENKK